MFTGIIEELGTLKSITKGSKSSKLVIEASKVLENTKIGDSIATNGVCLTVTKLSSNSFEADVMAETLRMSNLGNLNSNTKVNLERALSLNTRLGGHIVSGHIDGVGKITSFKKEDNATWVSIECSEDILKLIINKGSITIDGISLTVATLEVNCFKVSIIPHTKDETTLLSKKVGDFVNLENDIIGKYVERLMGFKKKEKSITVDFLKENGFF